MDQQLNLTAEEHTMLAFAQKHHYLSHPQGGERFLLLSAYKNFCMCQGIPCIIIHWHKSTPHPECATDGEHAAVSYTLFDLGRSLTRAAFQQVGEYFERLRPAQAPLCLSPYGGRGIVPGHVADILALLLYELLASPEASAPGEAFYWPS